MTDLLGSYGLILVVSAAIIGPLAGWFAGRRDRHPVVWLVFGALLGPIALLILAVAPPGRCPLCDTPVQGWRAFCPACGAPFVAGALSVTAQERAAAASRGPVETTPLRLEAASAAPASAIQRPVGGGVRPRRVGRPERTERQVEVLPGPAGDRSSIEPEHATIDAGEVLATAVYFGGTAHLVVGSRYVIVRHRTVLRLLGPVDQDPSEIALERPLAGLTATAFGERLIITEGAGERVRLALAMGAFAGATGSQLEVMLSSAGESPPGRRPASG